MSSVGRAEGTATLSNTQALRSGTVLYVDIIDESVETIRWTGVGTVEVVAPDLGAVATLGSGDSTASLAGHGSGAYRVTVGSSQQVFTDWDVAVVGATDGAGRLYSYDWRFNAGAFSESRATTASFYALVPGGAPGTDAVIELQLDGLAGYVYSINANGIGVDGPDGGRSVSQSGHTVTPQYPIYLSPPSIGNYNAIEPEVYDLQYAGGTSTDIDGNAMTPCTQLVPGGTTGTFLFSTNSEGSYHLQCDLNGDGNFDNTTDDDLLLIGSTTVGLNAVEWDGMHQGNAVATGAYDCRVRVTMGEFHYVGSDIETSYPGMRMHEVHFDGNRSPLTMYWNDTAVQGNAVTMPNGQQGLESTGGAGIFSDAYTTDTLPNVNARSWGMFQGNGKGNVALLDTYTWLADVTTSSIQVTAADPLVDTDGDGLGDFEEECAYGTDPADPDTDGDGTLDGPQYGNGATSGDGGGLESNGRLASSLARRAIERSRMSTMPRPRAGTTGNLPALAPAAGVLGTAIVEVTPSDLVDLTNATDVYALDYLSDQGERLGSVLLVETVGGVYEHSKVVCDRASGARLSDLATIDVGGRTLLHATATNPGQRSVDHLATFALHEQADASASLYSYWLTSHYPNPDAEQRVIRVQTWSKTPGGEIQLARAVIDAANARYSTLGAAGDEALVDDEDVAAGLPDERTTRVTTLPAAVMRQGQVLGGSLVLELDALRAGGALSLRTVTLDENAQSETVTERPLTDEQRAGLLTVDVGRALDVTVELLRDGVVEDQLWLSDGAWAAYDDALWGGTTTADFSRSECTPRAPTVDAAEAVVALAGCARTTATVTDDDGFGGVARHLSRPLSLDGLAAVRAHVTNPRSTRMCIHDPAGTAYCTTVGATPTGEWLDVPLARFTTTAADAARTPAAITLVTMTAEHRGAVALEVSGLTLSDTAPPSEPQETSGCAVDSDGRGNPVVIGLWLLLLGLGRRSARRAIGRG
ncbi:MAG: thrombospondin type 3 repeat-containing protein [Deltaproteobacteria bacterium]|nr:thrombospondin type 3 repeat-containing protein [Deltaproteobacteria bacterium]